MTFPTLALLSDFGDRDGFVGAMKGTIYSQIQSARNLTSQNPSPPLIDISHHISRHNIWEGAWVLHSTFRSFPHYTIFICVVDPKVGESTQMPILLHWPEEHKFFLAPDNGLLTPIIREAGASLQVYRIENNQLFMKDIDGKISHTFHGRDVYAPVAAHLANALMHYMAEEFLLKLGKRLEASDLIHLDWPSARRDGKFIEGSILHVDGFGNLITNIPNGWLSPNQKVEVLLGEHSWQTRRLSSYAEGEGQEMPFVVPASCGTLELTGYMESAQDRLGADALEKLSLRVEG